MTGRPGRLLTLESPLPQSHFMVRLLEPPGSDKEELWERLRSGRYDKPFVLDKGQRRLLQFDFDAIQSAMLLASPQRLILAYTREMMTFLLFNAEPQRILLLGLGGGSIAKFCYNHLPAADITAVEVSADVIALRREFSIPADDQRFRVLHADAVAHVASLSAGMDVVLADACDRNGIAGEFNSAAFYRHARNSLAPGGVFVTNVCGDDDVCAQHLLKLRTAFNGEVLTLAMPAGRNLIAFAFRDRRPELTGIQTGIVAEALKRRFRIDIPRYVRHLSR